MEDWAAETYYNRTQWYSKQNAAVYSDLTGEVLLFMALSRLKHESGTALQAVHRTCQGEEGGMKDIGFGSYPKYFLFVLYGALTTTSAFYCCVCMDLVEVNTVGGLEEWKRQKLPSPEFPRVTSLYGEDEEGFLI